MVVFCLLCRVLFRSAFVYDAERAESVMALDEREAITDPRLLVKSLAVLAVVVAAFVLHPVLHYEPSVVALLGAGLLVLVTEVDRRRGARARSSGRRWCSSAACSSWSAAWSRPASSGTCPPTSPSHRRSARAGHHGPAVAARPSCPPSSTTSRTSPPCRPVVAGLVPTMPGDGDALWWALAFGADLGGNATAIGASANVVDARPGRAGRAPDRVLGVHQVRTRGHRRHGRAAPRRTSALRYL